MSGMWIAKFILKHDCILGNRCKKFGVFLQSVNFSVYLKDKRTINSSLHYMTGTKNNLDKFIADLKKDKDVIKVERKDDTFLLIEQAKSKAIGFHTSKIIFVKPVLVKDDGYELWEVASWEKSELSTFIKNIEKHIDDFKLLKFVRTAVNNIFFPKLMPDLTINQKQALELAIKEGYYKTPRTIDLRTLAGMSKISLATYQEHLRKAEEKLIPNILSYTE